MSAVGAYIRVSTASQDHAMQRDAIDRAARARGETVAHWYAEKRSAKTTARPELEHVRAAARAGKLAKLYVWRLDRLARSGIRDTLQVVEELRAHGCKVASISDGFDLEGPGAEIVLAVIAWAAKMEYLAINERIAAARERARAEGKAWGRPVRMTPAEVAKMLAHLAHGRSMRWIASAMKIPRPTLLRALKRTGAAQTVVGPGTAPGRKSPRKAAAKSA